jgi:WD40 repeat protein
MARHGIAPLITLALGLAAIGQDRADDLPRGARARYGSMRFLHADSVECVAWTPDGRSIVSGSVDKSVRVWDAATGRERRRLEGHSWHVADVAVSPDGKLVASAGTDDKTVRIWDLEKGSTRHVIEGPEVAEGVAFSPDGKLLATSWWDGHIRFYERDTWKCERDVTVALKKPSSDFRPRVAFVDTETLAVGGIDECLRIVRGEAVTGYPVLEQKFWRIACAHVGSLVACGGGDGRKVVLFDVNESRVVHELPFGPGDPRSFWPMAFSPTGDLVVARDPDHAALARWRSATGEQLETLWGEGLYLEAIAFSPDGTKLAGGGNDHRVHVWDASSGEELVKSSGAGHPIDAAAITSDGGTLVLGATTALVVLDAATLEERKRIPARVGIGLALSPDGKKAVAGGWESLTLWDLETGRLLRDYGKQEGSVWGVAFSPDGDTFTSASERTLHLWSARSGKELLSIENGECMAAAFSPDGSVLAAANGSGGLTLYDPASGEEVRSIKQNTEVCAIAFSADGRLVASGGRDGSIRISRTATGRAPHKLTWEEGVRAIAFSPDGTLLATGGWGKWPGVQREGLDPGGVALWDLESEEKIAELEGHAAFVSAVAFTEDGKVLLSASDDGTVLAWDVPRKR